MREAARELRNAAARGHISAAPEHGEYPRRVDDDQVVKQRGVVPREELREGAHAPAQVGVEVRHAEALHVEDGDARVAAHAGAPANRLRARAAALGPRDHAPHEIEVRAEGRGLAARTGLADNVAQRGGRPGLVRLAAPTGRRHLELLLGRDVEKPLEAYDSTVLVSADGPSDQHCVHLVRVLWLLVPQDHVVRTDQRGDPHLLEKRADGGVCRREAANEGHDPIARDAGEALRTEVLPQLPRKGLFGLREQNFLRHLHGHRSGRRRRCAAGRARALEPAHCLPRAGSRRRRRARV